MNIYTDARNSTTDLYLAALHRHVEALSDLPQGHDERARAHDRWSHWFAVQRLARAAGMEVLEREVERQSAERGS
jgi:hypothetical protein